LTKLRRWEVWRRQDGTTYLTWGTKEHPVETETLVSSFYSANWLSAEREAFGSDPEIDEGVQPLVEVLHLFSGVMSTTACQGHPERGDNCAIIGLTFDDALCLKTFSRALRELERRDPSLLCDMMLDEERSLELPPEALAFELAIYDADGQSLPSPRLLLDFAHGLLSCASLPGIDIAQLGFARYRKDSPAN
jgi:hypothetical protein